MTNQAQFSGNVRLTLLCSDRHNAYRARVHPTVRLYPNALPPPTGENNCGGTMGNSLTGSGYGCELPALVRDWRAVWSANAGTTDPLAPFGIATLAKGGSEGHSAGMANMRWSQTANYGAWNNHALPNTFGAQLYDLGEPWANVDDGNKRNAFGNGTSCCYVPPGKPKTLSSFFASIHSCSSE